MPKITELASGQITPSPDHTITVELVEPTADEPARVRIIWPPHVTVTAPPSTPRWQRRQCGFWPMPQPKLPG